MGLLGKWMQIVSTTKCAELQVDNKVGRVQGAQQCSLLTTSAANRLIGEVVQSRRRPLLGPPLGCGTDGSICGTNYNSCKEVTHCI